MSAFVKINFDKTVNNNLAKTQANTYYTGQKVIGKVEIILAKVKKVRGICFYVKGFAKTHWASTSSTKYIYDGYESYICSKKYLLGSDLDSPRDIQPGTYTYHFNCTLPDKLPSSFEGTFGHIRYLVEVTFEKPWTFDESYSETFNVLKPLDLNLQSPHIRDPSEAEVYQKFWCGLCPSKAIHLKGRLPRAGFTAGEIIPFEAEIANGSNLDVKELRISLQCVISYQADSPELNCRQEIKDLACKNCDTVPKNSMVSIKHEFLVPAVPSSSNSCLSKLIQISYCIRVEAITSFLHKNAYVLSPITIGNYPLRRTSSQIVQNDDGSNCKSECGADPLPILDIVKNYIRSPSLDVTEL